LSVAFLMAAGCAATPPRELPTIAATRTPVTAKSTEPVDHAEICVKETTLVRVNDQRCDDRVRTYIWYYVPVTSEVPAVGKKAKTGQLYAPPRRVYRAAQKGGKGVDVLVLDDPSPTPKATRATKTPKPQKTTETTETTEPFAKRTTKPPVTTTRPQQCRTTRTRTGTTRTCS
jgi:hypothetical protein